jgi:hypothetical protein
MTRLNQSRGQTKQGQYRIDGVWRIVRDHVSVPADLEHGQAILNLTP